MKSPDVVIVGAGIVGAACAHELARQGLNVQVFDAAGIGTGVTAAGMGHLVTMVDNAAELALSRYSCLRWQELGPQLRPEDAYIKSGTLWVAADDADMRSALNMQHIMAKHGIPAHVLDAHELHVVEPALARSLAGGLLVPEDAIVYAPSVTQWLLQHSKPAYRITLDLYQRVVRVSSRSLWLADGRRIDCARILLANGLEARDLIPELPLRAKKGHLLITDRYPGYINHQLLELGYLQSIHQTEGTSVAFNIQPRPTGQLLIGSSRQFDVDDDTVDYAVIERMLNRATRFLPDLPLLSALRMWTGQRCASPDGLPLIGPVYTDEGCLWLALGHEGLGVATALGTADLIAALMLGHAPPIDPDAYLPQRFSDKFSHAQP